MARKPILAFDPNANDILALVVNAVTGHGIATVGGVTAYQIVDAAASATLKVVNPPTLDTFICDVFWIRCSGTKGAGAATFWQKGVGWRILQGSDSSHWALTMRAGGGGTTNLITSSDLAMDIWYKVRLLWDGTTLEFWVDSVSQGTSATNPNFATGDQGVAGIEAGFTINIAHNEYCTYSTASDRPGFNPEIKYIDPNGNDKSDEYGSETSASDASGDSTKWNQWATTVADDATTMNVEQGGATGKEISTLATVALTAGRTIDGAIYTTRNRANVALKTVDWYAILRDAAAVEVEKQGDNLADTSFRGKHIPFDTPPSGAWTDYVSSNTFNHASATKNLRAGCRSPNTNGANDQHTALVVGIVTCDDDPPAASTAGTLAVGIGMTPSMVF